MNKYNFQVSNFKNEDFSFSTKPEVIEAIGETDVEAATNLVKEHYGVSISNECDSIEAINLALEPSLMFIQKLAF